MGLFPIIMNVLQFWLIDSIVKASSKSAVALPDDSQQERLFDNSVDDEDDEGHRRYDVENPRPPSRSTDRTLVRDVSTVEGSKKSGSASPGMTPDSVAMHAYPPSIASTSRSPPRPPTSTSPKPRKVTRRRSPPPPLHLRSPNTITPQVPAIHHPKPSRVVRVSNVAHNSDGPTDVHRDWAESWNDSDNWANRIGEEEWAGRRTEQKKQILLSSTWDETSVRSSET
jgi:hypothetical protein